MDTKQTRQELNAAMKLYASYGAMDSEGFYALERIEDAIENGKPFPLKGSNPWELYQSVPGWDAAHTALMITGEKYWRAAITQKLGL
jgi:hypothetical protein